MSVGEATKAERNGIPQCGVLLGAPFRFCASGKFAEQPLGLPVGSMVAKGGLKSKLRDAPTERTLHACANDKTCGGDWVAKCGLDALSCLRTHGLAVPEATFPTCAPRP
jgi:hypothetical protein